MFLLHEKHITTGPETIIPHASRNPSPAHWQEDWAICLFFSLFPISHISQGLSRRSHPHLISYPGFVSALSWRHDRAQRCHGEKCQIKAKGFNREAAVMPCTSLPRRYDMARDEFQGRTAGDQGCADHLGLVSAVTEGGVEVFPAARNTLWTGHRSITGPSTNQSSAAAD